MKKYKFIIEETNNFEIFDINTCKDGLLFNDLYLIPNTQKVIDFFLEKEIYIHEEFINDFNLDFFSKIDKTFKTNCHYNNKIKSFEFILYYYKINLNEFSDNDFRKVKLSRIIDEKFIKELPNLTQDEKIITFLTKNIGNSYYCDDIEFEQEKVKDIYGLEGLYGAIHKQIENDLCNFSSDELDFIENDIEKQIKKRFKDKKFFTINKSVTYGYATIDGFVEFYDEKDLLFTYYKVPYYDSWEYIYKWKNDCFNKFKPFIKKSLNKLKSKSIREINEKFNNVLNEL